MSIWWIKTEPYFSISHFPHFNWNPYILIRESEFRYSCTSVFGAYCLQICLVDLVLWNFIVAIESSSTTLEVCKIWIELKPCQTMTRGHCGHNFRFLSSAMQRKMSPHWPNSTATSRLKNVWIGKCLLSHFEILKNCLKIFLLKSSSIF